MEYHLLGYFAKYTLPISQVQHNSQIPIEFGCKCVLSTTIPMPGKSYGFMECTLIIKLFFKFQFKLHFEKCEKEVRIMVKEEKDYQFDNHSLISTFKNELKNNN
jgi:hypothetical protein